MDFEKNDLELNFLEVISQHTNFIIGCCYRAPGSNAQQTQHFTDQLQSIFNDIIENMPDFCPF